MLIFFMRYLSEVLNTRIRLGQDEVYREIILKIVSAEAEISAVLSSFGTTLPEIKSRLIVLEKILMDIE